MIIGDMYVAKFYTNSKPEYSSSRWIIPNFKNIFIIDYFKLHESFVHADSRSYFSWIEEMTKNIPLTYISEH
jgi:hypothetical protein